MFESFAEAEFATASLCGVVLLNTKSIIINTRTPEFVEFRKLVEAGMRERVSIDEVTV